MTPKSDTEFVRRTLYGVFDTESDPQFEYGVSDTESAKNTESAARSLPEPISGRREALLRSGAGQAADVSRNNKP